MDDESASTAQDTSQLPLPQSVEELETLITRFYGFNTPKEASRIDTCLKAVQKTHGAFALADQLLNSVDANARFFGALTFTVKINRDWTDLSASEGKDLLDRLLFWLIHRINAGDTSLVIRKLCSALVAIFKGTSGEWTRCVQHILVCLANGRAIDYEEAISSTFNTHISAASILTIPQIKACLWFGTILVEEVTRLPNTQASGDRIIKAAAQNTTTLLDIIEDCLAHVDASGMPVDGPIKLLHTLGASSYGLANENENVRMVNIALSLISSMSPTNNSELLPIIADLATDFLANRDGNRQIGRLLAAKLLEDDFIQCQEEIQTGDFNDDSLVYGRLLCTVATAWVDDPSDRKAWLLPQLDQILDRLVLLAGAAGYPIDDDTLIPDVMIFWSSFVEWEVDFGHDGNLDGTEQEEHRWASQFTRYISRVLEALLKKLQLPPTEEFSQWERQAQVEFRNLRRDFRDFSASAYTILGISMLDTLVTHLLRLWAEQNWQGVEITIQCLKGVTEVVADLSTGDRAISTLLESPIFSSSPMEVPADIQRATIDLVADCSPFLERQEEPPTAVLEWLFSCISNQPLSLAAAKAISAICDGNRKELASTAPSLVSLWCNLADSLQQNSDVVERLSLAVGSVLQAFWADSKGKASRAAAVQALDTLLNSIYAKIQHSAMDSTPQGKDLRMTALQSLANLAQAFREADSGIVDLDDDDEASDRAADPTTIQWIRERSQQSIEVITQLLQAYPTDGDLMEVVCLLLRAGTTDDLDNPFRTNPKLFTVLVQNHLGSTTRPVFLVETISRWLRASIAWVSGTTGTSQYEQLTESDRNDVVGDCIAYALHTLERLKAGNFRDYSEHVSAIFDLEASYIPADIRHFFSSRITMSRQSGLFVDSIVLATTCLSLPEPILKQAAAGLWTKMLDTRSPSGAIHMDATAILARFILEHIPSLVRTLVFAVSGQAARSDLDSLLIPFRRLIIYPIPRIQEQSWTDHKIPDMKTLLSAALTEADFPSRKVNESQKRMFLEKLIRLRGEASGTGKVVREWWVTCRGTFS